MTHVLPQQEVVEAARTQVVENLTEYLADYLGVQAVLLQDQVELGQEGQQLVQGLLGVDVAGSVEVVVCAVLSSSHWAGLVVGQTSDTLVLQQGDHQDGLDLLLHDLGDALVDPDSDVRQDPSVG